jgi:hypothetical protein
MIRAASMRECGLAYELVPEIPTPKPLSAVLARAASPMGQSISIADSAPTELSLPYEHARLGGSAVRKEAAGAIPPQASRGFPIISVDSMYEPSEVNTYRDTHHTHHTHTFLKGLSLRGVCFEDEPVVQNLGRSLTA